jgi:alpha-L-fucosidase
MPYTPDPASLRQHSIPEWYPRAKFGIFIHWSLSTIPAWAPTGMGDFHEVIRKEGFETLFRNNPYSEWYQNGLRLGEGPVWEHHRATWGADFPYERFKDAFNARLEEWDPGAWADAFQAAGARYVVLVTKHHDGFCLWPSAVRNPRIAGYHASRDVVGELAEAVRSRGMRMGLYYSGALDWTFGTDPIRSATDTLTAADPSAEYGAYAEAQYRELIERHRPSILWNDIAYPVHGRYLRLLADYYNEVPDGVVNDRWMQTGEDLRRAMENPVFRRIAGMVARRLMLDPSPSDPGVPFDYSTLEYNVARKILPRPWECVRGIGNSFGYTANEPEESFLKPADGIRLLADVVSTNGNLLLNIGPKPGGTIQDAQAACIRGMGEWLAGSGEAIYGTSPWIRPEGRTSRGVKVRFTAKGADLFAILAEPPSAEEVTLVDLPLPPGATVSRLPDGAVLPAAVRGRDVTIRVPALVGGMPVALKIAGGNRDRDGKALEMRPLPRGQPNAAKTVRALVREKTVGALVVIAVIATLLALAGFNPATSGSAAWTLAFSVMLVLFLAVQLPMDMASQARKELFQGKIAPDPVSTTAGATSDSEPRSLWRSVLPRAVPAALAAAVAACIPLLLLGRAGIVVPTWMLTLALTAASFVPVALVARRILPAVFAANAVFVTAPATSRPVPGFRHLLVEHVVPRLFLMTGVNLVLGLMIAAGQAVTSPSLGTAEARSAWGTTFLILLVFCFSSAGDYAAGDAWSGRLPLSRRKGRLGPLAIFVLLVAIAFMAGYAYQALLAACGTSVLTPWAALRHKMIGVWLATILGCWLGVSWTAPRVSRKVRDRMSLGTSTAGFTDISSGPGT